MPETSSESFNGDFRVYLEKELARRKNTNPAYSLSAFARFLGVETSRLSKYLREERPIGTQFIERAAERLKLSKKDIDIFRSIAEARLTVPSYLDTAAEFSRYKKLSPDISASIEDWRHYAILELMKVEGFENNSKWIAKSLGISEKDADKYIERLQDVGLLTVLANGSWKDVSEGSSTDIANDFEVTHAQQRAQKTLLKQAVQAIDLFDCDERHQASMMMAADSSRIAGAKKMANKFLVDLCQFLESGERKDAVYQLSISLFPLVKAENEKNV
jgi:uncharacterized protein (TIGR02147 family)